MIERFRSAFSLEGGLIVGLLMFAIGVWVVRANRRPHRRGDLFLGYLLLYFAWRFVIEFWKPEPFHLGLSSIQWACLLVWVVYAQQVPRVFGRKRQAAPG